jgi:hypothetical protein
MALTISHRPVSAEGRVRSRVCQCGICGGQSGTGTGFSPSISALHYKEKRKKKLIIFITGLHNQPEDCGASVASAAGPFTIKKTALCNTYARHLSVLRSIHIIWHDATKYSFMVFTRLNSHVRHRQLTTKTGSLGLTEEKYFACLLTDGRCECTLVFLVWCRRVVPYNVNRTLNLKVLQITKLWHSDARAASSTRVVAVLGRADEGQKMWVRRATSLSKQMRLCSCFLTSLLLSESDDNESIPQQPAWFAILGRATTRYQHSKMGSIFVRLIAGNTERSPVCNGF